MSNEYIRTSKRDGLSAYQLGVKNGTIKVSEEEWKKSLSENDIYFKNLDKISDYFYSIDYDNIDYDYSMKFFKKEYGSNLPTSPLVASGGGCSSIRNGKFLARSYDWNYDNTVYFLTRTEAHNGRYASVGVAGILSKFSKSFVESRTKDEIYKVIPFLLLDGVNEKGVGVSINVVPVGDRGYTVGTNPKAKISLCQNMIPRYILDNFSNATDAVNFIKNDANIYGCYSNTFQEEIHVLVADVHKTYIIEFIDNKTEIIDVTDDDRKYMTNFHVFGTQVDENNHIIFDTVTDFGMGLERYNIIADAEDTDTLDGMKALLEDLKYTNAYDDTIDPYWKTECVGDYTAAGYGIYTIHTPIEEMTDIIERMKELFAERSRDTGKTWYSQHASIYDLVNRKLYLSLEENYSNWSVNSIKHYYTKDEIDALILDGFLLKGDIPVDLSVINIESDEEGTIVSFTIPDNVEYDSLKLVYKKDSAPEDDTDGEVEELESTDKNITIEISETGTYYFTIFAVKEDGTEETSKTKSANCIATE